MIEADRKELIDEIVKRLTPDGETPFEAQKEQASSFINSAIDVLSHATHVKMERQLQENPAGGMTPEQFKDLIRPWNRVEICRLLGIKVSSSYLYTKVGKGALKHVPHKCAEKLIEIRKQYNRINNIKYDVVLATILDQMGHKEEK